MDRTTSVRRPIALCAFLVAAGAHLFAHGGEPLVRLEPNPAHVNEKVTLSIVFDTSNVASVVPGFPALPPQVRLISGPNVQPYVDPNDPATPKARVSYVLEGAEGGRFVIPSISVTAGNASFTTGQLVVSFGISGQQALVIPLRPSWSLPVALSEGPLYVGEAIPLSLLLANEPGPLNGVQIELLGDASGLKQVKLYSRTHMEKYGTFSLYPVPAADYELTPDHAGNVVVPPARLVSGDREGTAAPLELRIRQAPSAIASTGAIGSFTFRGWVEEHPVTGGTEILVHERVEGDGNLNRLELPAPSSTGLLPLGRSETHAMTAGTGGYTGFRERVYRFLATFPQNGTSAAAAPTITIPRFVWFQPVSGRISSVPARTLAIAPPVSGLAGQSGAPSGATRPGSPTAEASTLSGAAPQGSPPEPLPAAAVERTHFHSYYTHPVYYLFLLPGPIALGFELLLRRPRRRGRAAGAGFTLLLFLIAGSAAPADRVQQGVDAYRSRNYAVALRDLSAAQSLYPRNAALSYDLALAQYRNGLYGKAIHSLRTAIYFAPLDSRYRAALAWMVSQIGVSEQVPPPYPIHPDLYLLALILLVNAAAVLAIVAARRRSGAFAIPAILCGALALAAAGGLVYASFKRAEVTGVVASAGTEMTKIPFPAAGKWMELPEGMAVYVEDRVPGYYLVQTAYGLRGWVEQKDLLIDGVDGVMPSASRSTTAPRGG